MKGTQSFRVSLILTSDGERYPILLGPTGSPLWAPTLYVTSQLRNASLAPSTTRSALDSISRLLQWAAATGVELEPRFSRREFLSDVEIDRLAQALKTRAVTLTKSVRPISISKSKSRVRAAAGSAKKEVSSETAYNRITATAAYLEWLAKYMVERASKGLDQEAVVAIALMDERLKSKRGKKLKSELASRIGLSESQQSLLSDILGAEGVSNPFRGAVRARNALILDLLNLGLRSGEMLSLKVSDIDFQSNLLAVARRHGDPDDPRRDQPLVKTRDRVLPISDELAARLTSYVLGQRRASPAARQHAFLLVTHRDGPHLGQPLTYKALVKLFSKIRLVAGGPLDMLSPHVLRHTVNDRLSELADSEGTPAPQEEKMRSYLMGWREGSGSSATYTKRHTRRKAMEASLRLQSKRREGSPS